MPTYLQAFKAAKEDNPNLTISEFDTMVQENPALVTAVPKAVTRLLEAKRYPVAASPAEVIEMAEDPEGHDVIIEPIDWAPLARQLGENQEVEEIAMVMAEHEEIDLEEDEDEEDPLYFAVAAEIEAGGIRPEEIVEMRHEFAPNPRRNDFPGKEDLYAELSKDTFWSTAGNNQTAQSDSWWKPPAESASCVVLDLHSSKAYNTTEWYRQLHGLEIGMRWREEQVKWPFLTRFTKKSKSVRITFKMPFGSPTSDHRSEGVVKAVKPLLRKDFGVKKVRVKAIADPYYELIPVDETWDARKLRLKKKYLGPILRKINSIAK